MATALHAISLDLRAPVSWTTWTVSGYALGFVTAAPLAGRLSDTLGRKRMLLACVGIFTAGSVCCGLAPNVFLLVAFRVLQAMGGGGIIPSATGVIADIYGQDRERPIGLFTSIVPLGSLMGPALGGVIVTYTSWRYVFFINVPLGVTILVALARVLPPHARLARARPRLDVLGSVLFGMALLALMVALATGGAYGFTSGGALLTIAVAGGLAIAFIRRQLRSVSPILPVELFARKEFAVVNGLNLVYGAGALGIFNLVPLFSQLTYRMPPLQAGILLAIRAAAMASMSAITALILLTRWGYRRPMMVGFALVSAGLLLMSFGPHGLSPWLWLAMACVISGVGVGMSGPPSNNAALQLAPGRVAALAGIRMMFRQTGGIVAVTFTGALIGGAAAPGPVLIGAFALLGALIGVAIPAIWLVPEQVRLRTGAELSTPADPGTDSAAPGHAVT